MFKGFLLVTTQAVEFSHHEGHEKHEDLKLRVLCVLRGEY